MFRRTFENQVFEQVRHPRLAVIFVARADQVGDVDGDRLLGRVREEQHAQTVGQTVFGNALDRGYPFLVYDPYYHLLSKTVVLTFVRDLFVLGHKVPKHLQMVQRERL